MASSTPVFTLKSRASSSSNQDMQGPITRSRSRTLAAQSSSGTTPGAMVGVQIAQEMAQKLSSPIREVTSPKWTSSDESSSSGSDSTPPSSPPRRVTPQWSNVYTVMPTMTTSTTSMEEQIAHLTKVIEGMSMFMQTQDQKLNDLNNKVEILKGESSHTHEKDPEMHEENDPHQEDSGKNISTSGGMIPIDQLKDFIMGTIKEKIEGSKSTYSYVKPYTQRIENLKMPIGYQPPKFVQFDGKGNPRQHVAHFVETCNNAGTSGDHLVKQFVRSLKANAFDWYTDLEPGSIDSWQDMEREFLNRFYSTRRVVSLLELTTTRQWKDESVIAYIERWRDLALNCKERISTSSAIDMCIEGMHWELCYILKGVNPNTFDELASKARNMELSITSSRRKTVGMYPVNNAVEQQDSKNGGKPFSKFEKKEAMVAKTAPVKIFTQNSKQVPRVDLEASKRVKPFLEEMLEKKYPFLDSDVPPMFEELMRLKLIDLPESKRPEEATKVDDLNYCKYHRILSHPTEKCWVLKDKIMSLAREGKIELADSAASTNQIAITFGRFSPLIVKDDPKEESKISQNRRFPFTVKGMKEYPSLTKRMALEDVDDKGRPWILLTRKKQKKNHKPKPQPRKVVKNRVRKQPTNKLKQKKQKKDRVRSKTARRVITLNDFMPKDFKNERAQISSSCLSTHEEEVESSSGCPSLVSTKKEVVEAQKSTSYVTDIVFRDEDLMLGATPHNRPLFVEGYTRGQRFKRIMIDQGSAVNILTVRAMKDLDISMDELSQSRLMIQGFNQGGQRAIGMIRLDLTIGGLKANTLCHVIDAKASYNLLLGRPWIHENGVIPSTWHQCFMYEQNGVVKKVVADETPFTEAETYFADAKFYLKTKISKDDNARQKEEYRPLIGPKLKGKLVEGVEGLTFPLAKIEILKPPRSTRKEEVKRKDDVKTYDLPKVRTNEGFDPNAYKLLAKAGYNPNERKLGKLIQEAGGEGTLKQINARGQVGLGYVQPKPIKILINRAAIHHISADEEDEVTSKPKCYVSDRTEGSESRPSIFDRMGPNPKKVMKKTLQEQLGTSPMMIKYAEDPCMGQNFKRTYVHERLGLEHVDNKSAKVLSGKQSLKKHKHSIPSRMRRETDVKVTYGSALKVEPVTIVHTRGQYEDQYEDSVPLMSGYKYVK
ncbi:unnamed protein product [Cuscuta epithymum]|uniref:Retrotransposon gag domain-containing protein n=1 Tax=Cuscuta epithymum TaxID=186058 RepID=A0AAV0EQF0_9ASTE|nr:unnamed protein product [Cuscuta epithymum]